MKKKVKKYAGGGLSGIASEATSLMGAADTAANAINSIKGGSGGGQGPIGGPDALGFLGSQVEPMVMKPNYSGGPRPNPPPLADAYKVFNQVSGLYNAGKPASFKKGGKVSSASKRADGIAIRGKTRA
jgi:hypothetical protein